MGKDLTLYFCDITTGDAGAREEFWDVTVSTEPIQGWKMRGERVITQEQAVVLNGCANLMSAVYEEFGLTDLRPVPGYPQGPNYSLDARVDEAIRELALQE